MAEETQGTGIKFNLDEYDESLVQETVEINPEANPMEGPPPISDGVHRFKLFIQPDSYEKSSYHDKKSGKDVEFYKCQFYSVCQDEGGKDNNKRIFGRENTLTFDGKNKMAYILQKVHGDSEEIKTFLRTNKNPLTLLKTFAAALQAEPIIKIKTEWQASYKDEKESEKKGKSVYRVAKSGQKNFPQNADGSYRPVVSVNGVGEVKAQAVALDYFSDN